MEVMGMLPAETESPAECWVGPAIDIGKVFENWQAWDSFNSIKPARSG